MSFHAKNDTIMKRVPKKERTEVIVVRYSLTKLRSSILKSVLKCLLGDAYKQVDRIAQRSTDVYLCMKNVTPCLRN